MFKIIIAIWIVVWPPAKRRAREAEAACQRAAIEARRQAEIAAVEKKRLETAAQRLRAYKAHLAAVDLNGIVTRDGKPMNLSKVDEEVKRRLRLASEVGRDPQIRLDDKKSDSAIVVVTGKLDRTALEWLLEHKDPGRQRDAASKILDARANLDPKPTLDAFATAVAETISRSRKMGKRQRIVIAVLARAILLRSADQHGAQKRDTTSSYSFLT